VIDICINIVCYYYLLSAELQHKLNRDGVCYLFVELMQTIVDGLVNVFLAVTVREGDVSPARHDRHKTSICTLTLKCVQWDDLEGQY